MARRRSAAEDDAELERTIQETANNIDFAVRVVGVRFQGQRRTRLTALSKAFEGLSIHYVVSRQLRVQTVFKSETEPIREARSFQHLHQILAEIASGPLLKQNFKGATNVEIEVCFFFNSDGSLAFE